MQQYIGVCGVETAGSEVGRELAEEELAAVCGGAPRGNSSGSGNTAGFGSLAGQFGNMGGALGNQFGSLGSALGNQFGGLLGGGSTNPAPAPTGPSAEPSVASALPFSGFLGGLL